MRKESKLHPLVKPCKDCNCNSTANVLDDKNLVINYQYFILFQSAKKSNQCNQYILKRNENFYQSTRP